MTQRKDEMMQEQAIAHTFTPADLIEFRAYWTPDRSAALDAEITDIVATLERISYEIPDLVELLRLAEPFVASLHASLVPIVATLEALTPLIDALHTRVTPHDLQTWRRELDVAMAD